MRSLAAEGISVQVLVVDGRASRWAYLRTALRMLGLHGRRQHYDLIHAHTGHCGVLARLQTRHPVLVSYVGYDLYGDPRADGGITFKSRLEAVIFRRLAQVVEATITKSAAMEDLLPAGARPRNVILPNGVDRESFRPIPRADARRALGWPEDELTILWAGHSHIPRKRLDLAEEVLRRVREELRGARLRICSGFAPADVPVWMNAADVLLFTSMAEGSPNVVKEAMACDLPIVSVDVGDTREVIEGTAHCTVVREPDPRALAAAVAEVLAQAPVRSDGRARSAHLGLEQIARRLVGVYEETAGRSTARGGGASSTSRCHISS
jgi:glycosyltransferase involved in cell wall biosynthesis